MVLHFFDNMSINMKLYRILEFLQKKKPLNRVITDKIKFTKTYFYVIILYNYYVNNKIFFLFLKIYQF